MRADVLRHGAGHDSSRVGYVELFFDLVFVFAVTQLSHMLIHHTDGTDARPDAGARLGDLVAVDRHHLGDQLAGPRQGPGPHACCWCSCSWACSCRRRSRRPSGTRRCCSRSRTCSSSSAGPCSRCGRWAGTGPRTRTTSVGSPCGSRCRAAFWIAGALVDGNERLALWVVAALIDVVGPRALFWVPFMGPTDPSTWAVRGDAHGRAGVAVPDHQPGRVDHRHRQRVRGRSRSRSRRCSRSSRRSSAPS